MKAPIELIDMYPTIMDLVGMETPKFVQGKSFAPLLKDSSKVSRESALTELNIDRIPVQGYSIKTNRYRLTQWGENGSMGYELYDHNVDSEEMNNLAENADYKDVKDSLINVIAERIANARTKPEGLGNQFEPRYRKGWNYIKIRPKK